MFTEQFDNYACFGDTIACEVDGFRVVATIVADNDSEAPWESEDGHGPVSDWTNRPKSPGERVLCEDREYRRYYDVQEAMAIAKRDGWGPSQGEDTPGQRAARAVEADFQALRAWCRDEWWYCGLVLSVYRAGVALDEHAASLWRIDLNHPQGDNGYLTVVANELLDEALDEGRKVFADLVATA